MTRHTSDPAHVRTHRSIFFVSTFVVALCTAMVTLVLLITAIQSSNTIVSQMTRSRAADITGLVAAQTGGAIRFGKVEALDATLADITGSAYVVHATALDAGGTVVAQSGAGNALTEAQMSQVADTLATGVRTASADGYFVVVPSLFGKNGDIAGALAIQWTSAPVQAEMRTYHRQSLIVSSVVFLFALIAAAWFLRWHISRPLVQIQAAIRKIAGKAYDTPLPGAERGDEIGQISRTLTQFRDDLRAADRVARDSVFRGAAFEGSAAAMLMTDMDLNVLYANEACRALLADYAAYFRARDPDFDPDALIGRQLGDFVLPEHVDRDLVNAPGGLPHRTDLRIGDRRVQLTVSEVCDEAGVPIGCVLGWSDVTEDRLNLAVIEAIDENQVHVEFSVEGLLKDINAKYRAALNLPDGALPELALREMVSGWCPGGRATDMDWTALEQGARIQQRFVVRHGDVATIVSGTIAQVRDSGGVPLRIILIGNDITEAQAAIDAAAANRAEMSALQANVVDTVSSKLKDMADGDLTVQIAEDLGTEYEDLRNNFNATLDHLCAVMGKVIASANLIGTEASSIAAGANNLSERTERQAATLEETAASIDALTASVRSAARSAQRASDMASAARDSAEQSETVARDTVSAMDEIARSSEEISKIINVIEDIAFQTNLLALNAGVEAARAGESGRGFAVVASEVRALAQRSSSAAQEINQLISTSGTHVDRGVALVGKMGNALRDIVTSITDISSHVSGIATSVQAQSGSLDEVNNAMADLDSVTQQNAAMFEETTAASHALTSEAHSLVDMTGRFKVGDDAQARGFAGIGADAGHWHSAIGGDRALPSAPAQHPLRNAPPGRPRAEDTPEAEADWDNATSF